MSITGSGVVTPPFEFISFTVTVLPGLTTEFPPEDPPEDPPLFIFEGVAVDGVAVGLIIIS